MNVTAQPQPQRPAPPARKSRSRTWIWLLLAGLIVVGIIYWTKRPEKGAGSDPSAQAGGRGPGGGGRFGPSGGRGPTIVGGEPAHKGDLRNYLNALGTVTALNTATVRSRVDGQLMKVHFEEGQRVKAGDLLAEIDPRSYEVALQQAEGQLARDRALLDNAKLDLERYLGAREAVTQQQIDTAKAAVAQYEGATKADEGSVANYRLQLSYCRVLAPIDGRVGLRLVDEGNLVRGGDTTGLVVITQDKPIALIFSIPEDHLPAVRRAMAVGQKLEVEVMDRSMQTPLATGALTAVDNQIDTTTGTVRMKAVVPNEDLALFPNQFVNVRLLVSIDKDTTLIPTSAIQINGDERSVYVVGDDGAVERRKVELGTTEGSVVAVRSGVAPGEVVVTEGLDRLQSGMKVTLRGPAPTPAATTRPPGQNRGGENPSGERSGNRRNREKSGAPPAKAP